LEEAFYIHRLVKFPIVMAKALHRVDALTDGHAKRTKLIHKIQSAGASSNQTGSRVRM
jgi:hypothetical protein